MQALNTCKILDDPTRTMDTDIIPEYCLMELVTPSEAKDIRKTFV